MKYPKVLVIATSRKTRGGITSVVKAHERGDQWSDCHCHWVQTHQDGSSLKKLIFIMTGFIDYIFRLPFYDLVHLHISQPTTVKRKKIFLRLAKIFNKKVITHFHAFNTEDTINGIHKKSYLQFFENSDRIIVLSKWWKDQLMENLKLPDNKISVLYNPCPPISVEPSSQEHIILYAGTVNDRKGYKDLLRAFAQIKYRYPDWKLIFAGNGEIEEGLSLSQELEIDSQVEFTGWVTGKAKDSLFRKACIFCLPSYAEGFPMAVLDAWAYGLPVITTPVGGIPDVAIDGDNMLLFNSGDINRLAENLSILINNNELREHISHKSQELASGIFNERTINQQLKHIYESI